MWVRVWHSLLVSACGLSYRIYTLVAAKALAQAQAAVGGHQSPLCGRKGKLAASCAVGVLDSAQGIILLRKESFQLGRRVGVCCAGVDDSGDNSGRQCRHADAQSCEPLC